MKIHKIIGKIRQAIRGKIVKITMLYLPDEINNAENMRSVLRKTYSYKVPVKMTPTTNYSLNGNKYTIKTKTLLVSYHFAGSILFKPVVLTELLSITPR